MAKHLVPLLILLAATLARFGVLAENVRFHGDEALFATYARNAAVYGDWMLSGPLDKPPVSLYAMALSMQFTGVSQLPDGVLTLDLKRGEWSARLPGVLAGIVTVALIMAAARRIGGWRAAWFAGVLAALSPQMAAFDATAFTDPLLVMFLTASLTAALYRRGGWSGVLLAAAFATKQQAVFYAPLVLVLNLGHLTPKLPLDTGKRVTGRGGYFLTSGRTVRRFLIAAAIGVGLLLLWDAARPEPSIFAYAADNNNPYRLIVPPSEWPGRVSLWLTFGATVFGAWPVTAFVVLCAFAGRRSKEKQINHRDTESTEKNRRRWLLFFSTDTVPLMLRLFIVGYIAIHIVLPFNIYDRYLLLIYPPVILLATRGLALIVPRRLALPALAVLALLMMTAPTRFPTDVRDRNDGLIALGEFINRQGLGTIVYNRWLGWEMGYYLGPWSDKRVVHYPTPEQFAEDAPLNPDTAPRLFIAPSWADVGPWLDAAGDAGFAVWIAYRSADYAAWWLEESDE
jgi:4-amino-4-deoxy-L-arabinose transferase-like glycosyltransferase